MGFMKGQAAVRRTVKYLEKGDILLRNSVKVVAFQFNTERYYKDCHAGLSKFVFWHLPQLKYKNPEVQFVTLSNLTPTPWIKVYFDNEQELLIDCDSHSRNSIYEHVKKMVGKTDEELKAEYSEELREGDNPGNFGGYCMRQCICEVPGQVPCPGFQPLPKEMTGKYKTMKWREEQGL